MARAHVFGALRLKTGVPAEVVSMLVVNESLVAVAGDEQQAIKAPRSPARLTLRSANRKLGPVKWIAAKPRPRPVPIAPFVVSTAVSMSGTCWEHCPFLGTPEEPGGCHVPAGPAARSMRLLDDAARGLSATQIIQCEVDALDHAFRGGMIPQDGARGGRDLRLHDGGDIDSITDARLLGGAAARWLVRGGGDVWAFTHRWLDVPRSAWGNAISVLASVERAEEIELARRGGYATAIVVPAFPNGKNPFRLPGSSARIVPCPAETVGKTCAECRLCMDDKALLHKNIAIAFKVHGRDGKKAASKLVPLGRGGAR